MCLNPINAQIHEVITKEGEIKKKIIFKNFSSNLDIIPLACGKCFECQKQKAREWSYRINQEASLYEKNCFITLTYSDAPDQLVKKDLQLFIKRLRRRIEPQKIRYFACGEYGSKGHRPHYHVIIFGWCPPDLKYFTFTKKKDKIYRSSLIEDLWTYGFSSVGFVSDKTAMYCANYCQKLNSVEGKKRPFIIMSTHPGIGAGWLENNLHLIDNDRLYSKGYTIKMPRYYNELAKRFDLFNFAPKIEANLKVRQQRAKLFNLSYKDLKNKRRTIDSKLFE